MVAHEELRLDWLLSTHLAHLTHTNPMPIKRWPPDIQLWSLLLIRFLLDFITARAVNS